MSAGPRTINQIFNIYGNHNELNAAARDLVCDISPQPVPPAADHASRPLITPPVPIDSASDRRPRRRWKWIAGATAGAAAGLTGLVLAVTPASIPADGRWPAGATAECTNGEFSNSHSRAGTCSSNGGVLEWRFPKAHPVWYHGTDRVSASMAMLFER